VAAGAASTLASARALAQLPASFPEGGGRQAVVGLFRVRRSWFQAEADAALEGANLCAVEQVRAACSAYFSVLLQRASACCFSVLQRAASACCFSMLLSACVFVARVAVTVAVAVPLPLPLPLPVPVKLPLPPPPPPPPPPLPPPPPPTAHPSPPPFCLALQKHLSAVGEVFWLERPVPARASKVTHSTTHERHTPRHTNERAN
jgi:hypothetical protein